MLKVALLEEKKLNEEDDDEDDADAVGDDAGSDPESESEPMQTTQPSGSRTRAKPKATVGVPWLQDLMSNLQRAAAESTPALRTDGPEASPSTASAAANPADRASSVKVGADIYNDLLNEAFGVSEHDQLEEDEQHDADNAEQVDGLGSATAREENLLKHALDSGAIPAGEQPLGRLMACVDDLVQSGMDAEDAVAEALLNEPVLMGNAGSSGSSEQGQGGLRDMSQRADADLPDPSSDSKASAVAMDKEENIPIAFSQWQDSINLSLVALQERRQAVLRGLLAT